LRLSVVLGLVTACAAPCRADGRAELHALIDKAVRAMGGQEKVARLRDCSWKGESSRREGGQAARVVHDGSVRGWDQYRVELEIQAAGQSRKLLIVLNGAKGWVRENDGKVVQVPKELLTFCRDGLYALRVAQLLPGLKAKAFSLSHAGEIKIGNTRAVGVRISHRGRADVNLFFDKKAGLPVKSEIRLAVPGGQETTVEYHFNDYKEFDGVKHFSKVTIKADGKALITELTEVKVRERLDKSLFAKP
jgi:hypothetical protein